jgi:hypothetical protein
MKLSASSLVHACPDVLHYSMKRTVPFNLRCRPWPAKQHIVRRGRATIVNGMINRRYDPRTDQCDPANIQNVH